VNDELAEALEVLDSPAQQVRVRLDGYEVRLTSLDKVYWPAWGSRRALLKRDLLRYYLRIAPYVLPHLYDRPVTMRRFPMGLTGKRFYIRSPQEWAPAFVQRFRAFTENSQTDEEYFVCSNTATLVWLGQLGNLELHVAHTRVGAKPDAPHLGTTFVGSLAEVERSTLNYPDLLVIDLDPYIYSGNEPKGAEPELNPEGFSRAVEVALWFREQLDGIGLHPFVKTTGKTGLHLYVPIARTLEFDAVRAVAETLARQVLATQPQVVTTEWTISARRGKVFVDYNMNRRAASLAAPYSPRAVAWAGVSTPLEWNELGEVYPTQFDLLNLPERLARHGDVWAHLAVARVDVAQLVSAAGR
jgi:bifunctional non-homologous end joining protein LigD